MSKRWIVPVLAVALMIASLALYAFLKPPVEASSTAEALPIEQVPADNFAAGTQRFQIDPTASQARYVVEEVLVGNPNTVIGATNQVTGQIAVNLADPTQSTVGTLRINARTFATDDSIRDRAVQQRILRSDRWEFITFTPTRYIGLPSSAAVGEAYSFQIIGNLTMRDVTRETTWDVTLTATSAERLEGSAVATIPYAEWGVSIPQVPFVADVADSVRLELDFAAIAR